jgi:hypothetical protein
MEKRNRWLLVLGGGFLVIIITMIVFGVYLVKFLQQTTDRMLSPIENTNAHLQTQVAQILHPTPTIIPDPVTIVQEIRGLSRLETIQYSVEKVITAEVGQGEFAFLFGDRLLFVAHGTVIAGVDLKNLDSGDVQVEDETVFVRLPPAEIFIATLNNDQSYVYSREKGILTRGNIDLETQARQVAEDEIQKAALEDGILEKARENGEAFIQRFLLNLGFSDVVFLEPQ